MREDDTDLFGIRATLARSAYPREQDGYASQLQAVQHYQAKDCEQMLVDRTTPCYHSC